QPWGVSELDKMRQLGAGPSRAPDSGDVAREEKCAHVGHEAGIFPENTAHQIVALEVAGSSPVGHPLYSNDALESETIRPQGFRRLDLSFWRPTSATGWGASRHPCRIHAPVALKPRLHTPGGRKRRKDQCVAPLLCPGAGRAIQAVRLICCWGNDPYAQPGRRKLPIRVCQLRAEDTW